MKNLIYVLLLATLASSCSKELGKGLNQDPIEVYNEFWTHVDEHYIYFDLKGVDWDSVKESSLTKLNPHMTEEELYEVVKQDLDLLKDGHNNLRTTFAKASGYNYKKGYDVNFDFTHVKNYATEEWSADGYFQYTYIDDIAYVYISRMRKMDGLKPLLRSILTEDTRALVIDIRNNGGGDSNPIPELLGDYVTERTLLSYYVEKSGPGHNQNTDPIAVYAEPSSDFNFSGPVILLTNRGSFSASSYMASMMKGLPTFTIIGQVTGGGGGGNSTYELSNGWLLSLSMSDMLDKELQSIEPGVQPDIEINNTLADMKENRDVVLERAIQIIRK